VFGALSQKPRDSDALHDKNADYTGPSPTQFAVTSKSTVLEVIPPLWT